MTKYRNTVRSRGSKRSKKGSWAKATAILFVPLCLLAFGAAWLKWVSFEYQYDDITLCLKNRPLAGHTVVVVDSTDILTGAKREYLARLIEQTKRNLKPFSKFSIFTVDHEYGGLPRAVFSLCNPGTADTTNIMVQAPAHVQKKYEQGFARPLDNIKDNLGKGKTRAETTPLLTTVQTITEQGDFLPSLAERKLILFSDMLEHSALLDHYKGDWEEAGKEIISNFSAPLDGIEVEVHYILREKFSHRQTAAHRNFWRDFFTRRGARYIYFTAQ